MRAKITAVILALASVLIILTGCHGSSGLKEFTIPEEFDTSKTYELTFWAKNDTNKVQSAIYEKAIEDFQTLYPNIHITIRAYTDYTKIYNDVITNIATNTTPNICITYPDNIATYISGQNIVVPLDELMDNEKYGLGGSEVLFEAPSKDEIIEQYLTECKINGTTYALPYMRSSEACYVNKTYVEALGYEVPDVLTWDFLWEVCDAATAKNEDGTYVINGQNVMIPCIYKSTDNMMIQYLKQSGIDYSDSEGNILIFNDGTKQFLESIVPHVQNGAFSTFKISSYPGNFFNAGQCIFAIDSTAGATWIGSHSPLSDIAEESIVEFETVVRTIPQVDPSNPQMISQGPSVCIFNKEDPQEVLASWIFLQYLLTNEVQLAYSETEGYVPVTTKAQQSDEYIDYLSREGEDDDEHYFVKIEAAKLVLGNTENTFVTSVFNGSASLREAAGQMIENVCKSTKRKEEINDAYFEKLYTDIKALYRLDQVGNTTGQ